MQRIHARRSRIATTLAVGAVAALALTACSDGAAGGGEDETFEFTYLTAATEGTPNADVATWYLDRIEEATDGRVTFDRTTTDSVCQSQEIVDCLRDGRGDIGVTIPDYTPQYFPTVSVVGIPFMNQNSQAVTSALYDLHTSDEQALASLEENGLHYVSNWPVGRFLLGTPDPVSDVAGISGLQARASGPVIQQVLQDAGMNINAITAAETYEAVERGVIDAVGAGIDFPVNWGLMELIPHWSDPGIGQYSTFGMWFSADAYESLPDDLRQTVDEVTAELNDGAAMEAFNATAEGQCQEMLDAPTVETFTAWDESATAEWEEQVGTSGEETWKEVASGYGLQDPDAFLDAYKEAYAEHEDAEYTDATLDCPAQFENR